jgi:hypothetical protein
MQATITGLSRKTEFQAGTTLSQIIEKLEVDYASSTVRVDGVKTRDLSKIPGADSQVQITPNIAAG